MGGNEETDTPSVAADTGVEMRQSKSSSAPRTLVLELESVRRINKSHNEMGEQNSTRIVSHPQTQPQTL